MLDKKILVAVAVVVALICLSEAREEGLHDMAEALKRLQELDRYYMQAARPRFGKRAETYTNWGKDVELCSVPTASGLQKLELRPSKPDIPAWLAYARRR